MMPIVTSEINRIYSLTLVYMSAQVRVRSTQRLSLYPVYKLISIYIRCDLDLWPPKSIVFIVSPWLTSLTSLMKKHTLVKSILCSKYYSIHVKIDLDLWPVTSKINRNNPLTMANMFAKFWWGSAQRFSLYHVHKLIYIYVYCDLDLWPPKSIGPILSLWLIFMPSLMKEHTTVKSIHVHKLISIYVNCDLDLLTSKINRAHLLVIVNMSAKFDE